MSIAAGISKKWAQLTGLATVTVLLTLFMLAANTAVSTYDKLWVEQARAFDTGTEELTSMVSGDLRRLLIKTLGIPADSWVIHPLDILIHKQYSQAVSKIPEDDFERVYWYHMAYYLPSAYGTPVERKIAATKIMPEVVTQLIGAEKLKRASGVIDDIFYYVVINDYAYYFFSLAAEIDKPLYEENRDAVLRTIYKTASEIDPEAFVAYGSPTINGVVGEHLTLAYFIFANSFKSGNRCDPARAKQWKVISDKTFNILIKDPKAASRFLPNQKAILLNRKLTDEYLKHDISLRKFIANHC
jgi:hypothetical protein